MTKEEWKVYNRAMKSAREKAKEMPKKEQLTQAPSKLFKNLIGS
ncbi:hypothetical protein GCM10011571_34860 [Marinithermofilum abyssi]|jgi:hypothetical protein|uniref:Uncharacterized protein n=1 Tax=Marinithermofilum abyssi TaxID=1571185 RepID=A0A8J2YFG4_9BACL|nr:hypothetical protein [Marinithermofilum abyssi]GGE29707.1 hypothetical protein GCM10011571_34860 [Marinithermofilum abyssi]